MAINQEVPSERIGIDQGSKVNDQTAKRAAGTSAHRPEKHKHGRGRYRSKNNTSMLFLLRTGGVFMDDLLFEPTPQADKCPARPRPVGQLLGPGSIRAFQVTKFHLCRFIPFKRIGNGHRPNQGPDPAGYRTGPESLPAVEVRQGAIPSVTAGCFRRCGCLDFDTISE